MGLLLNKVITHICPDKTLSLLLVLLCLSRKIYSDIIPKYLDFSGLNNTWEISYSFNLLDAAAKSLQSCPTLCDPIDGSPPGSPIPGILQARTLEWVAISFSSA